MKTNVLVTVAVVVEVYDKSVADVSVAVEGAMVRLSDNVASWLKCGSISVESKVVEVEGTQV